MIENKGFIFNFKPLSIFLVSQQSHSRTLETCSSGGLFDLLVNLRYERIPARITGIRVRTIRKLHFEPVHRDKFSKKPVISRKILSIVGFLRSRLISILLASRNNTIKYCNILNNFICYKVPPLVPCRLKC